MDTALETAGTMLVAMAAVMMVAKLIRGTAIPDKYPYNSVASWSGYPISINRRGMMATSSMATMGNIMLANAIGMDKLIKRRMMDLELSGGSVVIMGSSNCFGRR